MSVSARDVHRMSSLIACSNRSCWISIRTASFTISLATRVSLYLSTGALSASARSPSRQQDYSLNSTGTSSANASAISSSSPQTRAVKKATSLTNLEARTAAVARAEQALNLMVSVSSVMHSQVPFKEHPYRRGRQLSLVAVAAQLKVGISDRSSDSNATRMML